MMVFLKRFKKFKGRTKEVELFLMLLSYWWAITFLFNPTDVFVRIISYQSMVNLASQEVWGVLFLFIGTFHLIAMLYNLQGLKEIALLMATGIWMFISTMLFVSDIKYGIWGTGCGCYFLVSLMACRIYMKVVNS